MSIMTEIQRLQESKEAIKSSIINKGVEVPANTKMNEYSSLIDSIQMGGSSIELVKSMRQVINIANDTTYNSITPSSSSQQIKASFEIMKEILDLEHYEYYLVKRTLCHTAYMSTIPNTYKYLKNYMTTEIYNIGSANIIPTSENKVNYACDCANIHDIIYNNGSKGEVLSGYASGGIKIASTYSPSLNSQSSLTPTLTVSTNPIGISINSNYMQSEAFNYVDASNSEVVIKAELYRVPKDIISYVTLYNESKKSARSGILN